MRQIQQTSRHLGARLAVTAALASAVATASPHPAFAIGNALNMTNATYDTAGMKFGTAALSGGFGTAPSAAGLSGTTFTWETWVKLPSAPGAPIVALGSAAAGYLGANAAGQAVCNIAAGNTTITGPSLLDNRWHLLDLVGTPSGITCFVDGAVAGSSSAVESVPAGAGFAVGTMGLYPSNNVWTGELDEASIWSTARYKVAFTVPAAPYVGSETGLVALWHLNGTGIDNAGDSVLLPSSASILYSPLNWTQEGATASTINPGAYFRTMFTGSFCDMNFDTSNATFPYSQIYWRVDGYEAGTPWVRATPAANISCNPSSDFAAAPWHMLEVVVKSTSQSINRWNASALGTVVRFAGVELSAGAAAQLPYAAPWTIAVFGDSITEGVRTVNQTASSDVDQNDATLGWAYALGRLMGAEIGVIGFGGQGFTVAGSGGVPSLATSYNLLSSGVARNTVSPPQLIVINMGTNDPAGTNIATAAIGVLNGLIASYPRTPIALLVPFNQSHLSDLQNAAANCSQPSQVSLVQTAGLVSSANGLDSLGIHPTGPNNLGIVAPRLAAALQQILVSTSALASGTSPGLN